MSSSLEIRIYRNEETGYRWIWVSFGSWSEDLLKRSVTTNRVNVPHGRDTVVFKGPVKEKEV